MNRLKQLHNLRLMVPIIVIGISTGALTGAVVTVYRFLAYYAISFSENIYSFLKEKPVFIAAAVPVLAGIAVLLRFVYKKYPRLMGGGISDTMGLVGGIFSFRWLRSLLGTFTLSLLNFVMGVPLGNEGPCVLMGASLGKAVTRALGKKGEVWSRYSITGGASAGFAAATGSPMTGIIFVIEERHRRLSPVIIIITIVSVAACRVITQLLCPVFGISPEIFHGISLPPLSVNEMWIPLLTGITLGLFSIAFLHIFRRINKLFNTSLGKVDSGYKIFSVLILTLAAGVSYMIAVLSHSESINEFALERRIKKEREGKKSKYIEYSVTVNKDSFAEGKEINDIFWPHKLFVLSVTHPEGGVRHSGYLQEGDILRVGCNTYDEENTKNELLAIVGSFNNE